VGDAGFVPHVNDPDAAAGGGGQHFIQVIPDQREDGFDAQPPAVSTNNSAPLGIEVF